MKKSLVLVLILAALISNLSACQKKPEEKLAESLTRATSDQEVQRLNAIGKSKDEALAKLLGTKKSNSTESEKPAKLSDSNNK